MNLSELRAEYDSEVVGALILAEVERLAGAIATSYPPKIYARAERWSRDEIDELVQDVILSRLLAEHQLDYLFDVSLTIGDWRNLLARQVKITLAHRRVKTVVDNLLARAKRILSADPFSSIRLGRSKVYYIGNKPDSYGPTSQVETRKFAESVRHLPRNAVTSGERASAIYSTRVLTVLLTILLENTPFGLSTRDLGRIFEFLLTDWIPAILEQHDSTNESSNEPGPSEMFEVHTMAKQAVEDMSAQQKQILAARLAGLPDTETAPRLSISRPTLIKRRNQLFDSLTDRFGELEPSLQTALIDELAILVLDDTERNDSNAQIT